VNHALSVLRCLLVKDALLEALQSDLLPLQEKDPGPDRDLVLKIHHQGNQMADDHAPGPDLAVVVIVAQGPGIMAGGATALAQGAHTEGEDTLVAVLAAHTTAVDDVVEAGLRRRCQAADVTKETGTTPVLTAALVCSV